MDFEVVHIDPQTESNEDLEYAITTIRRNGVAIKGNIETKSEALGILSRNVAIRNELDLFVNVFHCKSYPGIPSHHQNVDIVVVRQNTEGEYAMLEHEVNTYISSINPLKNHSNLFVLYFQSVRGVVESMKIITQENSERLARYAFEYARKNGRKKVTTIHKVRVQYKSSHDPTINTIVSPRLTS